MPSDKQVLEARSRILDSVRKFFLCRDFIEVTTPVRTRFPALELHIDAEPSGDCFLRTSPELYMKKLLAEGHERIFEIGSCFRKGERGRLHNPEYSMLEWYRAGADYMDVLVDVKSLITSLVREITGKGYVSYNGKIIDVAGPWECFKVRDAFLEFAGWDPVRNFDPDRFDFDMVEKVEPSLPDDKPVVLIDYPAFSAALARLKQTDIAVAERWEVYIGGMELVNAYSELTDPLEQRKRFEDCALRRSEAGRDVYGIDEDFITALTKIPDCGGAALGIDRLVMLLTDSPSIDNVMSFCI